MDLTLHGAFTALATPFRNGAVDLDAMAAFTEFQIAGGIAGVVPCGTTGESPTLSAEESKEIIATVVRVANGRVPVIAGTGTNNTAETIARTRAARFAGADAAMVVMPYYNKPTQAGLIAHVRAIHDATELPLVLYNVPTRGTADLGVEAMVEIARHCPRVIALKEATGNIVRAQSIIAALGDRLTVLCGDDGLTLGMMACGARGVISVASNVVPAAVQGVVTAFLAGDLAEHPLEVLLRPLASRQDVDRVLERDRSDPREAASHLHPQVRRLRRDLVDARAGKIDRDGVHPLHRQRVQLVGAEVGAGAAGEQQRHGRDADE